MKKILGALITFVIMFSSLSVACGAFSAQDIPKTGGYAAETLSDELASSEIEYYGRSALSLLENSEALLFAYDNIASGIERSEAEISVYNGMNSISQEELGTAFDAYRRDHTEHFWLGNSYKLSYNSKTVLSISPKYIMTGEKLDLARAEFDRASAEFLSLVEGVTDEFERELILHDALAEKITYTLDAPNAHNAYGAIVEGRAVCEGYAEALQHLLLRSGIQSFVIIGTSVNPSTGSAEGHAWNAVKIDGKYYHTDLTWNDQGENIFHAYFNQPEEVFLADHAIDPVAYDLPVCNSNDAFYFNVYGSVKEDYSVSEIGLMLKENSFRAHVYVNDVDTLVSWYYANIHEIAEAAGVTGSFTYGYVRLGGEVVLLLYCKADFSGVSLSVGSTLALRYYIKKSDVNAFGIDDLAVKFTLDGKSITVNNYTELNGAYAFTLSGIPFYAMCDEFDAQIIWSSGATSATVLGEKNGYSVEKYCKEALELYSDDTALLNVVNDLLSLGRTAQTHLSQNTDKLPAEDVNLAPTEWMPNEADAASVIGNENDACFIKSVSVSFDDATKIFVDIYFSSYNFTLTVDGADVSLFSLEPLGDGVCRYTLPAAFVLDFDNPTLIELRLGNETVASIYYSVSSYAYGIENDSTASDSEKELALALYRLGKSCDTYAFLCEKQ